MHRVILLSVLLSQIISCLGQNTSIAPVPITPEIQNEFNSFKGKFNKVYTAAEEATALQKVAARLNKIKAHNQKYANGEELYQQGLNEYSDMDETEFNNYLNGFNVLLLNGKSLPENILGNITIPPSLNYTALGYTSSVRNQGVCGSCWTFSVTGMLEGQIFKKNSVVTKISEQNLVDCNKNYTVGNFGCNGGNMLVAYDFIKRNNGISKSSVYPYRGADTYACTYNAAYSIGTVASYDLLPSGNETLVLLHLIAIGPLSVAVDASKSSFQNYVGGILNDPTCTNSLNHAVLLTGYGTDTTQNPPVDFWIVKNSYGATWGERGYIRIKRGVNMCGIANYVNYALLA